MTLAGEPPGHRGLSSQPGRPDRQRRTREPNQAARRKWKNIHGNSSNSRSNNNNNICGVVMAADGGEHRKQKQQQQADRHQQQQQERQ